MKTRIVIAIGLLAFSAFAGTITINTTPEQDTRIVAAFRAILKLDHDPTQAEIKAAIIEWLKGSVLDYERRRNIETYSPTPFGTPSG